MTIIRPPREPHFLSEPSRSPTRHLKPKAPSNGASTSGRPPGRSCGAFPMAIFTILSPKLYSPAKFPLPTLHSLPPHIIHVSYITRTLRQTESSNHDLNRAVSRRGLVEYYLFLSPSPLFFLPFLESSFLTALRAYSSSCHPIPHQPSTGIFIFRQTTGVAIQSDTGSLLLILLYQRFEITLQSQCR